MSETYGGPEARLSTSSANYTIFYDSTGFYARNNYMGNPFIEFTARGSTPSLHTVFNAACAALGTSHTLTGVGGLIELSTPSAHIMPVRSPLLLTDQITLIGPGRACVLQAAGTFWSTSPVGAHNAPKAVIAGATDNSAVSGAAANTMSRVKIEGVSIDCAGISGTSGIWFERHNLGTTGGNESHSYINYCEVRDFAVDGIVVTGPGTSTMWMTGNNICHSDSYSSSGARGFNVTSADVHICTANNVKIKASAGWCMYLAGNSIAVTGELHLANNASGTTAGLIGLFGADHARVSEVYFDNLDRTPAVWVNASAAGGVSSRAQITHNFMHCDPSVDDVLSLVRIDNTTGPCYGIVVQGNTANQDQVALAGSMLKSQVDIINGASGRNHVQDSLVMSGNSSLHTNTFVTADFGPTGAGAAITGCQGTNIIDNNIDTGSTAGAASGILTGPGSKIEYPLASFSFTGNLPASATGTFRNYIDGAWTITRIRASVGIAPTGSPATVVVDVKKGGTSVFGGNAKPTINGSTSFTNVKTTFADASLSNSDYLTADIVSSDQGDTASDLTVQVFGVPF